MPPTAPIKSPSVPLTEPKSDNVVPPWKPSESYPVLEYEEGAPSASTPELIKVTRKKKRTTTGGNKKRSKDEDGAALSMS